MPYVRANGVDLWVEEFGTGPGIVCIHGTSSSAMAWVGRPIEALSALGRVIVYDRRGCTRSERPEPFETGVLQQAEDAAALIEALDAAPAVIVGRSYGGVVAVQLAVRRPELVRALVLLDPAPILHDEEIAAWDRSLGEKVEAAAAQDLDLVGEVMLRDVLGDEGWEALPDPAKEMVTANGPAILAEMRGGWLDATEGDLGRITVPTLLVSAADSPEALHRVTTRTLEAISTAEAAYVEGGHMVDPGEPAVLDFVRRVLA